LDDEGALENTFAEAVLNGNGAQIIYQDGIAQVTLDDQEPIQMVIRQSSIGARQGRSLEA
jgi:hypothetical protein